MDVQLQFKSVDFVFSLKVRLIQNGADIDIVYVYGRYINAGSSLAGTGVNFDVIPMTRSDSPMYAASCYEKSYNVDVPKDETSIGLGLKSITLQRISASPAYEIVGSAATPTAGRLKVGDGAQVKVARAAALGESPVRQKLDVAGPFAYCAPPLCASFANSVTGTADARFALVAGGGEPGEETTATSGFKRVNEVVYTTCELTNAYTALFKEFRDLNISGATGANAGAFHPKFNGSTLTVQFQAFFPGQYTACCWVTFDQKGSNIAANQIKAFYITDKTATPGASPYFGKDWDELTGLTPWAYRVTTMTMVMRPAVLVSVPETKTSYTSVLKGVDLASIRSITGVSLSGGDRNGVFFFRNDGKTATAQIQGHWNNAKYTACSYVTLTQNGNDVWFKTDKSVYIYDKNCPTDQSPYYGRNFDDLTNTTSWAYNPSAGKVEVDPAWGVVSLASTNTADGAWTTVGSNVLATATTRDALPPNGTVEIQSGGTLVLTAPGSGQLNRSFVIRKGGVLKQIGGSVFEPYRSYFVFEGGELAFDPNGYFGYYGDCCNAYVNHFTFANGGVTTGQKPMMLGYNDGIITVRGHEPARWNCGALLVGNALSYCLYVDVGEDADFITDVTPLREWQDQNHKGTYYFRGIVRKQGAGTWRMDVANPDLYSLFWVEGGTLELNVDDAIPLAGSCTTNGVKLAGGTLAVAAGKTNHLHSLTLAADSAITLGENAVLDVGCPSAGSWTAGSTLNITAPESAAVYFRGGLPAAHRRMLRLNGKRVSLDADGRVGPPAGLLLLVR